MSEKLKELFCRPMYERALLSYCFKSLDNYYSISAMVTEKDFLRPEHKMIYMLLGTLIKRNIVSFDSSLVINEAKSNAILDQVGGYDYVHAITETDVDGGNLDFYTSMVLDASTKYKLHIRLDKHLRELEKNSQNEEMTSLSLLDKAEADLMDLSTASKFIKEPKNLSDGLDEYIEERRRNPVEYCGISTGYPILDKRIDGLVPGTLTVVCARPKQGKSTFLSSIAAHVSYSLLKPVLYIDTEMPFEQWRTRVMAMLSGVPERKIKHGGYNDDEYNRITKAAAIIKKGKLFHEFLPGYDVDKLISLYKKYKHKEDIGLAIFDYIKAPQGSDFQNKKEYQVIGDVTTALKDLAGALQIPVIAANQVNRQDDIADSDRVLRYADVIAFFRRRSDEELQAIEEKYKPFHNDYGTYRLWIRESRRGGQTPEEGIGFSFKKQLLYITESKRQIIDYDSAEYSEKEAVDDYECNNSTGDSIHESSEETGGFDNF